MSGSSAFDADLGTSQGRVAPAGWTPPDGAFALVLGSDVPGRVRRVGGGDSVSVAQDIDFAGVPILRFRARFRAATLNSFSLATWELICDVNGDVLMTKAVARDREFFDLALPTSAYGALGPVPVTLALALVGTPGTVYAVELPAVYLDAVAEDPAAPNPSYTNHDPEDGEAAVPLGSPISVLVSDTTGTGSFVDPATVDVTVAGVAAMLGGVAQAGFTGSVTTLPDGASVLVTVQPAVQFASLVVVAVTASSATSTGAALSSSWSFTTADTIAPVVLAALALDPLTVRVAFDEPVIGVGDPSRYAIALVGPAPAVTPGVLAAEAESATTVRLTLDRYATQGAVYTVTVSAVTDLVGNVVTAPHDAASFAGYAWPAVDGRDVGLFKLLPETVQEADATGEHRRFLGALQELVDLFWALLDAFPQVYDPDTAPEAFVDLMLAELGNPFELALSLNDKRKLVQLLVPIYSTKGTGPGIVSAIRLFVGIDVTLRVYAWSPFPIGQAVMGQTWVLGSGVQSDLYTFQVLIGVFLTAAQRAVIREILDVMIDAREHYVLIEPTPVVMVSHWQLGYSLLGTQSVVH